jgi:hypothetical protein
MFLMVAHCENVIYNNFGAVLAARVLNKVAAEPSNNVISRCSKLSDYLSVRRELLLQLGRLSDI